MRLRRFPDFRCFFLPPLRTLISLVFYELPSSRPVDDLWGETVIDVNGSRDSLP